MKIELAHDDLVALHDVFSRQDEYFAERLRDAQRIPGVGGEMIRSQIERDRADAKLLMEKIF